MDWASKRQIRSSDEPCLEIPLDWLIHETDTNLSLINTSIFDIIFTLLVLTAFKLQDRIAEAESTSLRKYNPQAKQTGHLCTSTPNTFLQS